MPISEWKVFKTTGLSTPHELRNVLDQEINNYLMAMRGEGYQLISIERVDADSIFNDINHWVATSSYRFFWNTPEDKQKIATEKQVVQPNTSLSPALTKQNVDDLEAALSECIQTNIQDINEHTNEKIRALYSQMIKEEQLTALEQNIVKTISSELNIKLGVLSNNLRSYIDEQIGNLQTSLIASAKTTHTDYSDVPIQVMSIPEPPIHEENPLPEVDVPSPTETETETESKQDAFHTNSSDDSFSSEIPNSSDDDSGSFAKESDRVLVFSKRTTPISEVAFSPPPLPVVVSDIEEDLEEDLEEISGLDGNQQGEFFTQEESVGDFDFTKSLGLDLDSNLEENTMFNSSDIENDFFKKVPIGEISTPNKDFVEEDFGTTSRGILYPELDDPTNYTEQDISTEERQKAKNSTVHIDDNDM